ncbi:MAG: tol-pal system protein YbgF [Methylomonas sp.]|nr:tol-pal system protein YbgF [Methylomonas sp.]PPD22393.1 MAG: tol-pal system protein YbgF [Methylomonas sp.]PPD25862.1 MAG: tol-pal system protein YbgF [Methylomonas sp.]PPD37311.1 MAG: tol-pal system protein YbgF [Methylomonas sp.]PPD42117.1 MAG: tol-pal system protein YbgF [Methylomonas sp.]
MRKLALLTACLSLAFSNQASAQAVHPAYGQAGGQPSNGAIYEVLGRLEQLQSEVQQLRGMVEEQAQTIADLERKQAHMYADLDERVQTVMAMPPIAGQAAPSPPVTDPAAAAAATAPQATVAPATGTTATPTTESAPVTPQVVAAPAANQAQAQASEKERYQQAYEALRNGHNAVAVKLFEALLTDHPAGEFADNSQYWLGEAYKITRDYDKARIAFGKVVSQFPNSSKVPDALLKLGYIEFDQQNLAKARDYMTRVTTSYPGTTAAHLAAKKLAQMP